MKDNKKYNPIECADYDRLEAWATEGVTCEIKYTKDGHEQNVLSKIITFEIKDGVEYLIGEDGLTIRLDELVSVNGFPFEKTRKHQ